jgi:hypothetical protein
MSFKKIESAGDLIRFGCSLRIDCGHCYATRTVSALSVYQAFGRTPIEEYKKRLKCSRCGKKEAQLVVLDPL